MPRFDLDDLPGIPTTVECGGTEVTSTEPAPMRLWRPTVTGPSTAAPLKIVTESSIVGWRLIRCVDGAAERDTLVDRHIVADLGGFTDHHAHAVIDKKAPADFRAGMDLDAGKEAAKMAHEARQRSQAADCHSQCASRCNRMRVKARISKRDLPHRPQRRVALEDNLEIFFKRFHMASQALGKRH